MVLVTRLNQILKVIQANKMLRRQFVRISEETLEFIDLLENFDDTDVLTNGHVLSNYQFYGKGPAKFRSLSKRNGKVKDNIQKFYVSKNLKAPTLRVIEIAMNKLSRDYLTVCKSKKKETQHFKKKRKDFFVMLKGAFADGRCGSPVPLSPTVSVASVQPAIPSRDNSVESDSSHVTSSSSTSIFDGCTNSKSFKKGRKRITAKQLKTLYRKEISIRAAAELLEVPYETFRRQAAEQVKKIVDLKKESFDRTSKYVFHFDGKDCAIPSLHKKAERLCYVVTPMDRRGEFVIGIPFLVDKKAGSIAEAGMKVLQDWQIEHCIAALSFDTTATNTGRKNGVAVQLEEKMGRPLIWLPCRHHIAELVLGCVIGMWEGNTKSPTVCEYDRFRTKWKEGQILETNFESYFETVDQGLENIASHFDLLEITRFFEKQLTKKQIRDDYRELLELAQMFLGEARHKMKLPGCTSRARWMQKAIYSLKMYLVRNETNAEIGNVDLLEDICLFIVLVYIPYWYDATISSHTLKNDLDFIENIKKFGDINKEISEKALAKFTKDHLWYMGYHLSALSFFDERVSIETKKDMVKHLNKDKKATKENNRRLEFVNSKAYKMSDFISKTTLEFFEIMNLNCSFLDEEPESWDDNHDYKKAKEQILYLQVTNDAAERALSSLKNVSSTNEETIQNIVIYKTSGNVEEDLARFMD